MANEGETIWSERVRKVRRKVSVVDATEYCWVGVGGIVGGAYRRCIYRERRFCGRTVRGGWSFETVVHMMYIGESILNGSLDKSTASTDRKTTHLDGLKSRPHGNQTRNKESTIPYPSW